METVRAPLQSQQVGHERALLVQAQMGGLAHARACLVQDLHQSGCTSVVEVGRRREEVPERRGVVRRNLARSGDLELALGELRPELEEELGDCERAPVDAPRQSSRPSALRLSLMTMAPRRDSRPSSSSRSVGVRLPASAAPTAKPST